MKALKWDGMALGEPIRARLVLGDDHRVKIALSGLSLPVGDYLTQEQIHDLAELFLGLDVVAQKLAQGHSSR